MRITALSSVLVLCVLVAPAAAEHAHPPRPATIAAAEPAGSAAARARQIAGELGLTGDPSAPHEEPFLAAREITAQVAPHRPEIQRCYLDHRTDVRRAGHLDVTLVIARSGEVRALRIAAPGLPARATRAVQACIHELVAALRFPERRNDTTAIVPYYFQKTSAPGAGPLLGCWNPKGC
jgi:hypothetical protein